MSITGRRQFASCRARAACAALLLLVGAASLADTPKDPGGLRIPPTAPAASAASAASASSGYFVPATEPSVLGGKIVAVNPTLLAPAAPLTVTVTVELDRAISAVALEQSLRVFLDSVPLKPVGGETAPQALGRPAIAAAVAASGAVFSRSISLMVTTPDSLARDGSFTLSVYSSLDRREIASMPVKSQPALPFLQALISGEKNAMILAAGGLLALTALAALVVRQIKASELRVQELTSEVQSERQRVDDLGRVLDADKPSSAAPAPPYAPEWPPEVLQALDRRDLVIVTGMGVSAQCGLAVSRRLWLDVIDRMAGRIPDHFVESLRSLILSGDTDGATEAIVSLVGREAVLEVLKAERIESQPRPGALHRALAGLPVAALIDMTWDDLLPRALQGRDAQVIGPAQNEGLTALLRGGKTVLVKPLGDLRQAAGVALTQREYRVALSQAPELERSIAALFSTRTLLFIGLSLDGLEQFLTSLPPHLDASGRHHVALVAEGSGKAALWQAGQGSRFGVKLVEYRPSPDYRELAEAVAALEKRAARAGPAAAADSARMSLAATRLSHLQLDAIGVFPSLRVEFSPGWTLLLGNNGGGKSTILRAVALALAGNDARTAPVAARLLRSGANLGNIELGMGSIRVGTSLVRDGQQVLVRSPQTTALQAGQVLVLAFPALRGVLAAALKGPTAMTAANPSVDDVAPLLTGVVDSRLDNLQQWVVNVALQAEAEPRGRAMQMLDTFQQLVADMVPGGGLKFARVDRKSWQVIFQTGYGEVPFDGVSQGMSAILNWIGVLLQRLYDVYPQAPRPERETAIVLVDEIDAHLHPEWQRRLVALTRKHFPNVQVIASSHSPLLAGAVPHTELRVVAPDAASGQIRADTPRENLAGQKVEDILVSPLFSLPSSRSVEAEATIRRYFELFQQASLSADELTELDALTDQVKALNFGPTRVLRQQLDLASAAADQALGAVSAADVQALQARLRATPSGEA